MEWHGLRIGSPRRRFLIAVLLAVSIPVATLAAARWQFELHGLELDSQTGPLGLIQLAPLQQQPWETAETGWIAIAGDARPRVDSNFAGGALRVAGRGFSAGIGAYPTSDIVYRLQGRYRGLAVSMGVDDSTAPGAGATRFLIFGDGVKLFDSGVLHAGEPAQEARVPIAGVDELRLVAVDETQGSAPGLANWLTPRLQRPVSLWTLLLSSAVVDASAAGTADRPAVPGGEAERGLAARRQARQREQSELENFTSDVFGRNDKLRASATTAGSTAVHGWHDAERQRFVLDNGRIVLALSTGQSAPGAASILDRSHRAPHVYQATPGLELAPGEPLQLLNDTSREDAGAVPFDDVDHPALGRGLSLTQRYRAVRPSVTMEVQWTLYEGSSYLTYQARVIDAPAHVTTARFSVFDHRNSRLAAGNGLQYVTDYGRPRHGQVRDDGIPRREVVGEGKPVFVWSDEGRQSMVLAALEETNEPALFSIQLPPGRATANLGFTTGYRAGGTEGFASPLVFIDLPSSPNPLEALRSFRTVFAARYPALALPSWPRFEWNSWYAYYMEISDEVITRQVDYIAENLKDLGPWHISIDAGWNVAEGHSDADWRQIDTEKFPRGIRPVVDYARAAGVRSTLYFSAPYVDTRARPVNWLGLRGLVEQHPEWLIKLDSDETGDGYAYDFAHPGFRQYLRNLFYDYFVTHGVDGIEVDGLGTVPSALRTPSIRTGAGRVPLVNGQTMEIYRFIHETVLGIRPDALIYAGWHIPLFANQYSHLFWHSDESPEFTNPYPFGGLKEHVEYALLQQGMWGQRSHMGFAYGDPNTNVTARWWLEASIALGTHIALGFDLPVMNPATLSLYRERLAHYRPFAGEMFALGTYPPEVFGSHREGFTYLGVMNRRAETHEYNIALEDLGLDPSIPRVLLDAEAGHYSVVSGHLKAEVPAHSFRFYVLRAEPGVFWTNSSYRQSLRRGALTVDVTGPSQISGYVDMIVPRPEGVWVDGVELAVQSEEQAADWTAVYFEGTGILSVRYPHNAPHRVRVWW